MQVRRIFLTRFICRQFSDTATRESSVTFTHPVIFRPCNRGQFFATVNRVWSVRERNSETSKACRCRFPSTRSETPLSVNLEQFVNVRRSIRLHCVNGTTVPSLTFSVNAERFSLFTSSEYEKRPSRFPTEVTTLRRLSHLLQDGRCHSIPTQFAAQIWHTSIQFSISAVELSFENIAIRISGGSRPIGGIAASCLSMFPSRTVVTPTDDCESLACAMKKSVSSSAARSGDVEEEDSERASLGNRAAGRERSIATGYKSRVKRAFLCSSLHPKVHKFRWLHEK